MRAHVRLSPAATHQAARPASHALAVATGAWPSSPAPAPAARRGADTAHALRFAARLADIPERAPGEPPAQLRAAGLASFAVQKAAPAGLSAAPRAAATPPTVAVAARPVVQRAITIGATPPYTAAGFRAAYFVAYPHDDNPVTRSLIDFLDHENKTFATLAAAHQFITTHAALLHNSDGWASQIRRLGRADHGALRAREPRLHRAGPKPRSDRGRPGGPRVPHRQRPARRAQAPGRHDPGERQPVGRTQAAAGRVRRPDQGAPGSHPGPASSPSRTLSMPT